MSSFHTVTPGAAHLPIAFQARTTAAPGQAQHTGSTIPENAGQIETNRPALRDLRPCSSFVERAADPGNGGPRYWLPTLKRQEET
jgi:hypothetical protein